MIVQIKKKPIVLDACPLSDNEASILEAMTFMGQVVDSNSCDAARGAFEDYCKKVSGDGGLKIPTLEGEMKASFGDYIIKGAKGEFYPCKPDIIALTYDIL